MDLGPDGAGGLFLAVVPDRRTAGRIHRLAELLRQAHKFDREPVQLHRLHLSLISLGFWSRPMAQVACEAALEVKMLAFEVSFDRTASFRGKPGNRPFVLFGDASGPLKSLRQMLDAALVRKGLRHPARRDFTPHVTLLYGEREVDEYPVEPAIGWRVNEFVLIHSLRGHTHLGRWRFDV